MGPRRKVRLEDIARSAAISITTVSRALNDSPLVNARTKSLVWRLAREQNYSFRAYSPPRGEAEAETLALVIPYPQGRGPQLSDPFMLDLIAGVGEAARARGWDLTISHATPNDSEQLPALMQTMRANAVIFLGQSSLHGAFNRLAGKAWRFAVWGAQLPKQAYCSVGSDNVLGGRRATLHLARLGRRRIAFLGDIDAPESMQRREGYLAAMTQSGLTADPRLTVPAHFGIEAAAAAIDALIHRRVRFDAIVAASDLIALGAIRALTRAGMKVPGDVAVVGYDDISFAPYMSPALTTVRQDTLLAGRLLVSKLMNGEETSRGHLSERLPTDLIVRESCGS
ncbi:MAG: substrate-binding domain-containing protein [Steroidobacteraceae bacterium]|nr:substrate-binding domain-containing protein [Steroidobacteraceae bacterium]